MFSRLESNPRIHILTTSEIESLSGSPGNFSVSIRTASPDAINKGEKDTVGTISVGAVILATGWEPFDPTPLSEYGYGRFPHVVTNLEFEKLARERTTFLAEPRITAFLQCVGSRDERHLPYCSDVCCMVTVKQALLLKEANPANEVYVFYNDIRTPGEYEDFTGRPEERNKIYKGIPSEPRQDAGKITFPCSIPSQARGPKLLPTWSFSQPA
jgi:quinone-modifying oxidoreductase subunit QmoB